MTVTQIFLALLASGGGGAAITWGVVRIFGEKWLDSKFASRLQELRHEHERQMERVRLETSRSLDRSIRLSEREFETSAEAWSLVYDAYLKTMGSLPGLRQYSDFSKLSDEHARIVAEKSEFEAWEIKELLACPQKDRNNYFSKQRTFHELRDAKVAVRNAGRFLAQKALFIEINAHRELDKFVESAWRAIVAREIIMEVGLRDLEGIKRDDEEFRLKSDEQVKELEQLVRIRFWGPAEPSSKEAPPC